LQRRGTPVFTGVTAKIRFIHSFSVSGLIVLRREKWMAASVREILFVERAGYPLAGAAE
jgi:hypothetical protein